jgi:hypothetical protein
LAKVHGQSVSPSPRPVIRQEFSIPENARQQGGFAVTDLGGFAVTDLGGFAMTDFVSCF